MDSEDIRVLTREQLYDVVWSSPLPQAADGLGITIELLRRISRLLEVPLPKAGHWRRAKTPRRRSLPRLPKSALTQVTLRKHGGRTVVDSASVPGGQKLKGKPNLPSGAHPLVERAAKFYAYPALGPHGRMKPSSNSAPNLRVTEVLKERALTVAERLLRSLEQLGCDLQWRGNIEVHTPHATVKVSLQEEVISVEREPTPVERQRIWRGDQKFYVEKVSGRLLVQIESYLYNLSEVRSWRDDKGRLLERRTDEIASGIVAYSKAMADELERQAILKRQREEEWDRRKREDEARQLEKRRVDRLNESLSAWKRADEIRRFADEFARVQRERHGAIDPGSAEEDWLEWMSQYASRIDPLGT